MLAGNTLRKIADCEHPCPCGYLHDTSHACTCSDSMIRKYQQKISGPIIDRLDIHVDVPRVDYEKLTGKTLSESSAQVRERVERARNIQRQRFKDMPHLHANADMWPKEIEHFCQTSTEAGQLLRVTLHKMQLSARAYHRILKLARTIADLDGSEIIQVPHLAESIQYRPRRITG